MDIFRIIFLLILLKNLSYAKISRIKSGPFKASIVSVEPCANTTYPLDGNPAILMYYETYGSKIRFLRGNVTVVRDISKVQVKLKSFIWDGNKLKLIYLMNGISCQGMLLDLFCRAVDFQLYKAETCTFLKGQWIFKDMDINPIPHIWTKNMEYGKMLWRSETTVGRSTLSCWDFETLTEPA